jgi:hypothetical protein
MTETAEPEQALPLVPGTVQIKAPDEPTAERPLSERIKSTIRINPKLLPVKLLVFLIHGGKRQWG